MKNLINPRSKHQHSTYQLLVESEEKERGAFESVFYFLLIASTCAALWQFSNEPVTFTGLGVAASQHVAAQSSVLHS